MGTGFVHLQVASSCAYLHAASSPEALVAAAAAQGIETLALTDLHNPYGAPRFERACRAAGIRPIHGVEVGTTTDDALVLLVRDATGWANLCRLATAGNFAGGKGKPRLDAGLLGEFGGGLTALLLPRGQVVPPGSSMATKKGHCRRSTATAPSTARSMCISPSPITARRTTNGTMPAWRRGRRRSAAV